MKKCLLVVSILVGITGFLWGFDGRYSKMIEDAKAELRKEQKVQMKYISVENMISTYYRLREVYIIGGMKDEKLKNELDELKRKIDEENKNLNKMMGIE